MSSVLIVFVLIGMWAFVLVPLVRQRRDKADEIRSVARFSSALRVLSRGHMPLGGRDRDGGRPGMRQWVMPPREGFAAGRRVARVGSVQVPLPARLVAAVRASAAGRISVGRGSAVGHSRPVGRGSSVGHSRPVGGGSSAGRVGPSGALPGTPASARRRLLSWLGGAVLVTLLLALVAGTIGVVVQVLADVALVAGLLACRWSVAQERQQAAVRRRRAARARVARASSVTLPVAAPSRLPGGDASEYGETERVSQPPAFASDEVGAVVSTAVGPPAAGRVERPLSKPTPEPLVLPEIDLDWEPAVAEPASGVRIVDLTTRSAPRRTRLLEDPAADLELDDDSGLEALLRRRVAAGGW